MHMHQGADQDQPMVHKMWCTLPQYKLTWKILHGMHNKFSQCCCCCCCCNSCIWSDIVDRNKALKHVRCCFTLTPQQCTIYMHWTNKWTTTSHTVTALQLIWYCWQEQEQIHCALMSESTSGIMITIPLLTSVQHRSIMHQELIHQYKSDVYQYYCSYCVTASITILVVVDLILLTGIEPTLYNIYASNLYAHATWWEDYKDRRQAPSLLQLTILIPFYYNTRPAAKCK